MSRLVSTTLLDKHCFNYFNAFLISIHTHHAIIVLHMRSTVAVYVLVQLCTHTCMSAHILIEMSTPKQCCEEHAGIINTYSSACRHVGLQSRCVTTMAPSPLMSTPNILSIGSTQIIRKYAVMERVVRSYERNNCGATDIPTPGL